MRLATQSVPEVVREIITRNRSIYDCMKMDVINYTALAVKIQSDVERGDKKYHVKVPIQHRIEENSAKASYKNGILELVFKLKDPEKPKGKTVEVE